MNRRSLIIGWAILALTIGGIALAQVSYWFSQFEKQGNAQLAQQFFYTNGPGITITYDGIHSVISASGGGGGNTNVVGNFFTTNLFTMPLALTNGFVDAAYGAANYYPLVGNPSGFLTAPVANGSLANSSVTYNGHTVALGGSASLVLNSADFANEGTTTTVLHGNASGNPSWGAVSLANDVTGDLGVTHLNGGSGAAVGKFWQGDGTWASPAGFISSLVLTNFDTRNWTNSGTAVNLPLLYVTSIQQSSGYYSFVVPGAGFPTFPYTFNNKNLHAQVQIGYGSDYSPQIYLNIAGTNSMNIGYDPSVARGGVWCGTYEGLFIFADGKVGIGTGINTPANNALLVDQPNSRITAAAGIGAYFQSTVSATNGLRLSTNAAPTAVVWGVTPPDWWAKVYNQDGSWMGYAPVWTNH